MTIRSQRPAFGECILQKPGPAERRARRRVALITAAADTLVRLGAGASMNEIAKAANVPKPTIYRFFASRAELFEALFQHAHSVVEKCVEEQTVGFWIFPERVRAMTLKETAVFRAVLITLRNEPSGSSWIERLLDTIGRLASPLVVPGPGAPRGASKRSAAASRVLARLLLNTLIARLEESDGMTEEARRLWWRRIAREWQLSTGAAFQLDRAGSDLDRRD